MPSTKATGFSIAVFVAAAMAVAAVPAGGEATPVPAPPSDGAADRAVAQSDDPNLTLRTGARVEFEALDSTTAVRRQVAAGRLPAEANFTVGDPFVVEIAHAGLADRLGDGNATAAFLDVFGTPAANLTFEDVSHGPMRNPKWIDPYPNATRAFVDAGNDTTYVVVDTDRVEVTYAYSSGPQVDRNVSQPNPEYPPELVRYDEFRANVTLAGGSNLTAGDERVVATRDLGVRIRSAEIRYDDEQRERVYVDSAPNQTLRGVTNVRPGLDVTVVLRSDLTSSDTDEWVARRATATVAADGTFSAAFDLSGVSNGTVLNATVRFDDRNILDREGHDPPESTTVVVTAPTGNVEVRDTERNASGSYGAVTVDATLSRGGFVVLHRGSPTGPVAGVSGYLSSGSHEAVPVYVGYPTESADPLVAVVHRDRNQNRWFDNVSVDRPYATSGDAVAETGFAPPSPGTPREPASRATTTPTPTPPETTTPTTGAPGGTTESATADGADTRTAGSTTTETDGSAATATGPTATETTGSGPATPAAEPEPSPGTTTTGTGPGFGSLAALVALVAVGTTRRDG
ncbi:DUF7282 domain-containing protein [Halosimplex pelagicum]|uniref:DUF7282 domain-containing protein n=1 Tax=Halosimplex pelagicum TaxID=869886 RepID=A0A7D5T6E9_9EURY|nr:BGTF surface domain-containing protein [Halosimplex pelagicum]QLH83268.1 hypothetical protein HZS54_17235 [Halosimplex pelagicum]